MMEMIVWLGVLAAFGLLLWLAAPHHQRIIDNRDIGMDKPWD